VKENISTKEINDLAMSGIEIHFEVSLIELVDSKLYIGCIYRAPDGEVDVFLEELELLISKLLSKNKSVVLCGDWNIDLSHVNTNQKKLTDVLERYNLINTVLTPTRITKSSSSLLDLVPYFPADNAHPVFSVLTNFFSRYRTPYVYHAPENTWNRTTGCGQARI
jgi:hypothetical protein